MNIEATHLGKQSDYPQNYDASVLVAVPRQLNREHYHIDSNALPFTGYDTWHAYEFSFLTESGLPVAGILKLVYLCNNEYLVESKSLKLYLNSFNMERMGANRKEGILKATSIIQNDMEELLKCEVKLAFFDSQQTDSTFDFKDFDILENTINEDDFHVSDFSENVALLKTASAQGQIKWGTHLLRSNCKITHQPDWGSLYLKMDGDQLPSPESFLKYVISLRNENHFHEEICEMVFKRLMDIYQPQQLLVACLYTRRGGIDICPVRAMSAIDLPKKLINSAVLDNPSFRQ